MQPGASSSSAVSAVFGPPLTLSPWWLQVPNNLLPALCTLPSIAAAFVKGSTERMSVRDLPQAIRLLGMDPDAPPVNKLVRSVAPSGVLDRHVFTSLMHQLLRGSVNQAPTPSAHKSKSPKRASAKSAVQRQRTSPRKDKERIVDSPPREPQNDVMERLARAFVACPSEADGSVAGRDVIHILTQAGVAVDSESRDVAARATRVRFETLVTIATGGGGGAPTQGPSPPRRESPPLRLSFTSLSLAPWAVSMPSLHALCVTLSAEVQTDSSEMPNVVPVALRSPIMLKTVRTACVSSPSLAYSWSSPQEVSLTVIPTTVAGGSTRARPRMRFARGHGLTAVERAARGCARLLDITGGRRFRPWRPAFRAVPTHIFASCSRRPRRASGHHCS